MTLCLGGILKGTGNREQGTGNMPCSPSVPGTCSGTTPGKPIAMFPYAGRRTDFRDKNRELFSGELFSGELFSGVALLPENFVPINVCAMDSFSPN